MKTAFEDGYEAFNRGHSSRFTIKGESIIELTRSGSVYVLGEEVAYATEYIRGFMAAEADTH